MGHSTFAEALSTDRTARGAVCSVGTMLARLDSKTRSDVEGALSDDDVSHASIARALHAINVKTSPGTVGRHRNGYCRCD